MNKFRIAAVAVTTLGLTGFALAHHPFEAEFDVNAPVRLSGAVTKVDWNDPHVVVHLDVADAGGQNRNWSVEAASPNVLQRKGWQRDMLKEGQRITIQGFRAKSEPFVAAARSIVLSDGKSMSSADETDGGPVN